MAWGVERARIRVLSVSRCSTESTTRDAKGRGIGSIPAARELGGTEYNQTFGLMSSSLAANLRNGHLDTHWSGVDLTPLREDNSGTLRVGPTRLTLDLVLEELERGTSPEEMLRNYPFRSLDDILGTIAFAESHRDQVNEYLAVRKARADEMQAFFEARRPPITRTELLARRAAAEAANAPNGH